MKFDLGTLVMTSGVNDLVAENAEFAAFVNQSLKRHANGDWGDVDEHDKEENNQSLTRRLRLLSAYNDNRFPKHGIATIWIITEADRSATTILFPDEY